jgi:hypothetical protein
MCLAVPDRPGEAAGRPGVRPSAKCEKTEIDSLIVLSGRRHSEASKHNDDGPAGRSAEAAPPTTRRDA